MSNKKTTNKIFFLYRKVVASLLILIVIMALAATTVTHSNTNTQPLECVNNSFNGMKTRGSTGVIKGCVKNIYRCDIINATVLLWDKNINDWINSTTTDRLGNYVFCDVEEGVNRYKVGANATGYYNKTAEDVGVFADSTTVVNFTLLLIHPPAPKKTNYLKLETLVVIYTNCVDATFNDEEIVKLKQECLEAKDFYWRNSHLKLDVNMTYMIINEYKDISEFWEVWDYCYWLTFWDTDGDGNSVEQDLYDRGVVDNQYDGVVVYYAWKNEYPHFAAYGGGTYGVDIGFLGQTGYTAIPLCWDPDTNDWYFIHEFHHQMDSMFHESGYPEYPHADHPWKLCGDFGENYDFNAFILSYWPISRWFVLKQPWGVIVETGDEDEDGFCDDEPAVYIDELRFNSSALKNDTDDDGYHDLQEVTAGIFDGSDPKNTDTDDDKIVDGNDKYPIYPADIDSPKKTIIIDGFLEDDWHLFIDHITKANTNFSAPTYVNWNDDYLYIGMWISKPARVKVYIDADNNGWFHGMDNYEIIIIPTVLDPANQIEKAHIYDCRDCIIDYNGGPMWDDDSDYPYERNITEEDIARYCTPNGTGYSVEIGVPRNENTSLVPKNGDVIGLRFVFEYIDYNVNLKASTFEEDFFVDANLVIPLPSRPANINTKLDGANNENVTISWTLSKDDGAGENDIVGYDIYYNITYNSEKRNYSLLTSVEAGVNNYTHVGAGDGDSENYFYYVVAKDKEGNTNPTINQAGKFVRILQNGRQLISLPLIRSNTDIATVLRTIEGNYNYVQWYDSVDTIDHWKTYSTAKPSGFNDLFNVNHTIALWITMTSDDNLTIVGKVPKRTDIQLFKGWNFAGYPSFIDKSISETLKDTQYKQVEGFDNSPPYYLKILKDEDVMSAGNGYWIFVGADCQWNVFN